MRKSVYPFEYIDDWEKFNKILLPEKENFCCHLNIEDITDTDYTHAKKSLQRSWNKKFRKILWLVCSKRYIIVSSCIWELSKYVSWYIWESKFLSANGLRWQTTLKKPK